MAAKSAWNPNIIKKNLLSEVIWLIKYLAATLTGKLLLSHINLQNVNTSPHLIWSLAYRLNMSIQSTLISVSFTTARLDTYIFGKIRLMLSFMCTGVKASLKISITKRKIKTVPVLTLMLVAVMLTFEAFLTKTASKRRFNWLALHSPELNVCSDSGVCGFWYIWSLFLLHVLWILYVLRLWILWMFWLWVLLVLWV